MVSDKIKMLAFAIVGILGLDYLFHKYFTVDVYGSTNITYFIVKAIIVYLLVSRIYNKGIDSNFSILKNSALFALLLGLYYRGIELTSNLKYGTVAPNIVFGSTTLTLESGLIFPIVWFVVHSIVFFTSLYIYINYVEGKV